MPNASAGRRAFLLGAAALATPVWAQDRYPSRNMEMMVPWGPGGGADFLGRLMARWFEADLKATMPVVNAPGAGGTIGLGRLVAAPPDGHNLGVLTSDTTMMAALQPSPGLKLADMHPLAVLSRQPSGLFTRAEGRFKSWAEVMAEARARPGTVSVATTGPNSPDDLTVSYLGTKGVKMISAGYNRPGERYTAVLGGHTDLLYEQAGDVRGHIEARKLIPLIFFAPQRLSAPFADVPVASEFGYDFLMPQARSLVVRAGTEPRRLAQLAASIEKYAASADYASYLREQLALPESFVPMAKAPAFLAEEIAAFRRITDSVSAAEKKA